MSKHLQKFLYFTAVQTKTVPVEYYEKYFNGNVLSRYKNIAVQQIDSSVICGLIKSIRIYTYHIKDLIDFRASCLLGVNKSRRMALNLANILQLYIAAYQHESIREKCWRSIVNVWNHTIETSLERFCNTHEFDVHPVLQSIMHCQLHQFEDQTTGKPLTMK